MGPIFFFTINQNKKNWLHIKTYTLLFNTDKIFEGYVGAEALSHTWLIGQGPVQGGG